MTDVQETLNFFTHNCTQLDTTVQAEGESWRVDFFPLDATPTTPPVMTVYDNLDTLRVVMSAVYDAAVEVGRHI